MNKRDGYRPQGDGEPRGEAPSGGSNVVEAPRKISGGELVAAFVRLQEALKDLQEGIRGIAIISVDGEPILAIRGGPGNQPGRLMSPADELLEDTVIGYMGARCRRAIRVRDLLPLWKGLLMARADELREALERDDRA